MKYIYIGIVAVILLSGIPIVSAANITYPDEYYSNGIYTQSVNDYLLNSTLMMSYLSEGITSFGVQKQSRDLQLATFLELRRQTILMEKQNEMLAEQNRIAWIEACYAPHTSYGYNNQISGNIEQLRAVCNDAGYPTND